MATVAVQSQSQSESPSREMRGVPRRLSSQDILTETLVQLEDSSDYTDHLEDLVRMQVTPQLHSRRSQHNMLETRSLIPRLYPSSSPSPSPEALHTERGGSMSRIPTSTNMSRANSTASPPTPDENENDGQGWETLQVGRGGGTQPFPATTPTRKSPRPSNASDPNRKRAQSTRPHPSTSTSTPQSNRKPYSNRTNFTPSPSSCSTSTSTSKKPSRSHGTPPIRRKSISTAREFSSYDLSSLPPEAFAPVPPPPAPPQPPLAPPPHSLLDSLKVSPDASGSNQPLVYKNSRGELTDRGKFEDLIIPTIAKRLEAERLDKKLREGHEVGLVDEWGVDGTPRTQRQIEAANRRKKEEEENGQRRLEEEAEIEGAAREDPEGIQQSGRINGRSRGATETVGSKEKLPTVTSSTRVNLEPGNVATSTPSTDREKEPTNRQRGEVTEDKDAAKAGCCSCIIC